MMRMDGRWVRRPIVPRTHHHQPAFRHYVTTTTTHTTTTTPRSTSSSFTDHVSENQSFGFEASPASLSLSFSRRRRGLPPLHPSIHIYPFLATTVAEEEEAKPKRLPPSASAFSSSPEEIKFPFFAQLSTREKILLLRPSTVVACSLLLLFSDSNSLDQEALLSFPHSLSFPLLLRFLLMAIPPPSQTVFPPDGLRASLLFIWKVGGRGGGG